MNAAAKRPQVVLSSNLPFYSYGAVALQREGYLKRYICAIALNRWQQVLALFLPQRWQNKLETRKLSGLDEKQVMTIWMPEVIQRCLFILGRYDRGNWVAAHLFDWLASLGIKPCDIFHFVSSTGLYSARRAKAQGSIIICDERQEHFAYQRRLLDEEYASLGWSYEPPTSLVEDKIRKEHELADFFIVPSSYARQTYVEMGIATEKIFLAPYGVELLHFSRQPTSQDSKAASEDPTFRIIFTGQLIPRKGIHYLITAFQELALPDSELVLIGDFGDVRMQRLIESSAAQNPRIKIVGHVPKLELAGYYNQSSVFVLPSLADSYGLVTLEAMACGLPVVVTENSGSKEAVRDGVDGFVVPIRDIKALKEKLLLLYHQSEMRRCMGEAAAERAKEFTWERYGERLVEIYEQIWHDTVARRKLTFEGQQQREGQP